jgi:hypothetical protein
MVAHQDDARTLVQLPWKEPKMMGRGWWSQKHTWRCTLKRTVVLMRSSPKEGAVGEPQYEVQPRRKEGWIPLRMAEVFTLAQGQMSSSRLITDITGTSSWSRRYGDMPIGYSRQAALRRE